MSHSFTPRSSTSRSFSMPALLRRPFARLYGEEIIAAVAFALCFVVLSAQALMAHEFKIGPIEVVHPWSRATPGGATVGGGYLAVRNDGATPDRLIAAASPVAGRVEIHEMAMKDGVMTMRPVTGGIVIPAGGKVELKPGSYHLMFLDLKVPLKEGTLVDGSLTFEKAGTVAVQYKVEAVGASGDKAHSGH